MRGNAAEEATCEKLELDYLIAVRRWLPLMHADFTAVFNEKKMQMQIAQHCVY